nr:MAG TPA: hypothetical protein [Caudoviricetes sp.]
MRTIHPFWKDQSCSTQLSPSSTDSPFLSTLVVPAWAIFPTLVAGYLTFLDN